MSIFPQDPSIFKLGGRIMPGTLIEIANADREWVWEYKPGTGTSMGTSTFKGAKLCEGFSVTIEAVSEEEMAEVDGWRKYVAPPNVGDKPVTFKIENWVINWNKIDRGSIKKISQPKPTDTGSCLYTFEFGEYNPPAPAKTGKADPAKGGAAGAGGAGGAAGGKAPDSELAALQAKVAGLAKQATAVTT